MVLRLEWSCALNDLALMKQHLIRGERERRFGLERCTSLISWTRLRTPTGYSSCERSEAWLPGTVCGLI